MATIKITELSSIGSNLASSTVIPVVNMSGTPTTEKTLLGNIANVVLAGAGSNYAPAGVAILAQTVTNAAQPNITSTGTLTNLTVSGNVAVNGNVTANGTAYVGNLSTTGLASITTLSVGATANLGAVANVKITGGTAGQLLSTDGTGNLSWASDATTYGNSNVAAYLPTYTGNIGANVVIANLFAGSGANLTSIAGANVSGFVPNANVANTALAVAAANVSGLGNIATINLTGSNSNVLYGNGVFAAVAGGANTGNVTFDDVTVQGVNGLNLSAGADFTANLAYLQVRAGDVVSHIHLDTGNNQAYDLIVGDDQKFVQVSSTGNILMSSYDGANSYQWNMDTTGNLNLPLNGNINANGGGITQVINQDFEIVVQDEEDDGWSLLNTITDSLGNNLSRTTLDSGSFTITTDITGTNHSWGFEGNTLQVSNDSQIRSFGSNVVLQSMSSGSGGTASLQSVSNTNDPNIFSAFDATTTGANIVVYNGGSNGGVGYTWQFANDGRLTFPGTPRIDTDANNFEVQAAENINFEANAVVNIYTDAGNTTYQWQFGDDGNLIVPGNTAIYTSNATGGNAGNSITIKAGAADQSDYYTTAGGNLNLVGGLGATDDGGGGGPGGDVNIASGLSADPAGHAGNINITAGSNDWVFDYNGDLTLPGNLVYIGASPAPSISGFSSVSALVLTTPVVPYANLPAATTAGRRAFISDANLVAVGNFGNVVGNGGSNTVCVWSDGTDWRIG